MHTLAVHDIALWLVHEVLGRGGIMRGSLQALRITMRSISGPDHSSSSLQKNDCGLCWLCCGWWCVCL